MAEGAEGTSRPDWRSYLEFDRGTGLRLVAAWVSVVAFGRVVGQGRLSLPRPGMFVQSIGSVAFFTILFALVPVRRWAARLPGPHRLALGTIFFLVVAGQLATSSRQTFPFPSWTMYGKAQSPPRLEYYRYAGVDSDGRSVSVDPAEILAFVNVAEIASHVREIAREARLEPGDPKGQAGRAKLHDLLVTIARAYDLKHPRAPLRSLEFLWYSWEYRSVPADRVAPERLLKIELPEGAAK